MEGFAIILFVLFGIFLMASIFTEDFDIIGKWFLLMLIVSQLFWIPSILPTKIDTEYFITNFYNNITFEKPVRIVKTRTYKPASIFFDETTIEIYFTDVCGKVE